MTTSPGPARRQARQAAVQAIYQWQLSQNNLADIEKQFREEQSHRKIDFAYFSELLKGVPAQLAELDGPIGKAAKRELEEISPVELAILRLASYELKNRIDIPYRVVLNEAVDMAKKFSSVDSHKFVNSALDVIAREWRAVEINARNQSRDS